VLDKLVPGSEEAWLRCTVAQKTLKILNLLAETRRARKRYCDGPEFLLRVFEVATLPYERIVGHDKAAEFPHAHCAYDKKL
jgi:hypothetical protein